MNYQSKQLLIALFILIFSSVSQAGLQVNDYTYTYDLSNNAAVALDKLGSSFVAGCAALSGEIQAGQAIQAGDSSGSSPHCRKPSESMTTPGHGDPPGAGAVVGCGREG
jgi:hypothetical protein